jgi:two-component system, OmpR family, sensor kinase
VKVPSLERRFRLVLAGVLVAVITLMALATTLVLQDRLERDARDRLEARVALAATLHTGDAGIAQLSDRDITVTVGADPAAADEPGEGHGHRGRKTVSQLADGTPVTFVYADVIGPTINILLGVEAVVGLIALAAALLTVSWLTKRSLAPLDAMTAATEEITSGKRGTRLRPERSDTELGRLATSFDSMLDAVEASEARLRQFVADASHELRTPTAAIQAAAEALIDDDPDSPDHDQRLFDLVGSTHRLSRLVHDLLDLDRLHGAAKPAAAVPVDLVVLVDELLARLPSRDRLTFQRTGAAAALVEGHQDRLGRVLSNVIDNAQRHSPDSGTVTVDVQAGHREIVVTVTDQGPGVPPADRERIFDRFTRLDTARTATSGGNGLGLSISRAIATEHGGTLTCIEPPEPGIGAVFVLRLPHP